MSEDNSQVDNWIQEFLDGLIETDEDEKKPENVPPQYRDDPDFEGGIHYWQLQQCISELASLLLDCEEDLDEIEARWKNHELFWGRYLSTGAIEYTRRWRQSEKAGEDYFEEGEFSMDWFGHVDEDKK